MAVQPSPSPVPGLSNVLLHALPIETALERGYAVRRLAWLKTPEQPDQPAMYAVMRDGHPVLVDEQGRTLRDFHPSEEEGTDWVIDLGRACGEAANPGFCFSTALLHLRAGHLVRHPDIPGGQYAAMGANGIYLTDRHHSFIHRAHWMPTEDMLISERWFVLDGSRKRVA